MSLSAPRLLPRVKVLSAVVASCFAGVALANPTGPVVVGGAASFASVGKTLTVTNSPNAIIHWQGFSIGAGEITRFQQQSASSAVLNRVVGQDPSAILGTLSSNGRVYLVNPNGILFGQGSRVDVAGLVATTLNLSNSDFLAGRLNFEAGAVANSLVNQGEIVTASGGRVLLIAPDVQNHGLISSPQGEVVLAAGKSVQLVEADLPMLKVELASGGEALNVGSILAEGGKIGVYAGLINQRGVVRADSASVDATGKVVFRASDTTILDTGSVTSASGARGGEVQALGNKVGLVGNASIDVSGEAGGGTVLVGGDFQGKNAEVQNAHRTYFGPEASIKADAVTSGDGGKVIVWSDDATRAYGTISARGGAQGGNGGFVEISGKNWLDFSGSVDTRALNGRTGTLLLDPSTITISNSATSGGSFSSGVFAPGGASANVLWSDIDSQLASNTVVIQTTGSGGTGNLTVSANSPALSRANDLMLVANNDLTINGTVTNTGGGSLKLVAGWNGSVFAYPTIPSVTSGTGSINVNQNISIGNSDKELLLKAGKDIAVASGVTVESLTVLGATNRLTMHAVGGSITASSGSTIRITPYTAFNTALPSTLELTAGGSIALTVTTVSTAGGAGLNLGDGTTAGGAATISIQAGDTLNVTGGSIVATGGIATPQTNSDVNGRGAATVTLTGTAGVSLTGGGSITATGGAGGGTATEDTNLTITSSAGNVLIDNRTIQSVHQTGGSPSRNDAFLTITGGGSVTVSGASTLAAVFGRGSNTLSIGAGTTIDVIGGSNLSVTAGSGLAGANLTTGNGGAGGNGGAAMVSLSAPGNVTVNASPISATAGAGGVGGSTTQSTFNGGAGGAGGSASISISSTAGIASVSAANVSASGGAGAAGGSPGAGGTAGAGGAGGAGSMTVSGVTAQITDSTGEMGDGVNVYGGNGALFAAGGAATLTVAATSGGASLTNSILNADGGNGSAAAQGEANLVVQTTSGDLNVTTSALTANAGSGFPRSNSLIRLLSSAGGNISVDSLSSMQINSSGPAKIELLTESGSGTIGIAGPAIEAYGVTDSKVNIKAAGDVTLGAGTVEASVGTVSGTADVLIKSTNGGISSGADIISEPEGTLPGTITLDAANGSILSTGGMLKMVGATLQPLASGSTITLTAKNGIGSPVAPVRIYDEQPDLVAGNSSTGGMHLSFTTGDLNIDGFAGVTNSAAGATIDITAETGNINVLSGVTVSNPNGSLGLTAKGVSPLSGTISVAAAASVASASGGNVTLVADNMDLAGPVTAGATGTVLLAPYSTSRDINIYDALAAVPVGLNFLPPELSQVTAGTLQIGRATDTGQLRVTKALNSSDLVAGTLKLAHQFVSLNQAIDFSAGGESLTLTPGSQSTLLSSVTLGTGGTLTLEGATSWSNGTLGGVGNILINGATNWSGGDLSGTGKLTVGSAGSLAISGAANRSIINGYDLDNLGTVDLTHSGAVFVTGTPTTFVTNTGVWNANQTAAFGEETGGGSFRFTNDTAGTLNRTVTGAGTILNFSNNGTLNAQAGTLSIDNRGGFSSAGTFRIDSGATLRFVNSAHTVNGSFVNGTGAGTLALSSTTLNIGANVTMDDAVQIPTGATFTVNPGVTASVGSVVLSGGTLTGTGSLTVTTDFSQTSGTMGTTFNNLSITKASGDLSAGGFGATNALSLTASAGNVNVASPIAAGGDITLDAQGAGSSVNVSANIAKTTGSDATLTVRAAGDIVFSGGADVSSSSNKLHIVLNADRDASGAGRITLASGGTGLSSNGGNVTLGGGADPLTGYAIGDAGSTYGVLVGPGAAIDAGAGNISIRGKGMSGADSTSVSSASGVRVQGAVVQTTTGSITIDGMGGAGLLGGVNRGIDVLNSSLINSVDGTISLTGAGGSSTGANVAQSLPDGNNRGIVITNGAVIQTTGTTSGLGNIILAGTGGTSVDSGGNSGVLISQTSAAGTRVRTVSGNITINGSAGTTTGIGATTGANRGVSIGAAEIRSTGTGSIAINGTGGTSVNNTATSTNSGVLIQGDPDFAEGFVTTAGGTLSITGTAGSNSGSGGGHEGIAITNHATVQTGGSGTLTLTGTAAAGNPAVLLKANGASVNPDHVRVEAGGTLNVTANGLLVVAAGTTLGDAYAELVSNGDQAIAATGIVVTGGASGGGLNTGNYAEIGAGGNQTVTVGASGISLTGGGGTLTENYALIYADGNQTVTVNNGGNITLQGGSSQGSGFADAFTGGSFAYIANLGSTQQINMSGGTIAVTGGTVGSNNAAAIYAFNASQTITGSPNITLLGGASGGASGQGNRAVIGTDGAGASQSVTAAAISASGGNGGTDNYASLFARGAQAVSATSIGLMGGEGSSNYAQIVQTGASGLQTIAATGAISLTAGGNSSSGAFNHAQIVQSGSDLQHVSAGSITATAGGGATGDHNRAAIFTSTGSTASQLVDIGSGGLTMLGGTGSGGENKAGIWVLADFSSGTTNATQVVNVSGGGSISLTGGSGATNSPSGNNNSASIAAYAKGASGSQTVNVTGGGGITLTGGSGGLSDHGSLWSYTPAQVINVGTAGVSNSGITLQGNGGASGTGNKGLIYQQDASGSQTITVYGGGDIQLTGGSGSGGANAGQILSDGNGLQWIKFADPGSTITLNGGTGNILLTASSGNYASIDATAGNQKIEGTAVANNPAITVHGGDSGGNTNGSTTTILGNTALIRAGVGTQTIAAGALQVSAGNGGVDNSATVQAPIQVITASSVSLSGGVDTGSFAGARIGGIGGLTPGATNLALTTTGDVTVSGGLGSGASIGSNPLGGVDTSITIDSGGNVTLAAAGGAGARIGSPNCSPTPCIGAGDITVIAAGTIAQSDPGVGVGTAIRTAGNVTLQANAVTQNAASSMNVGGLAKVTTVAGATLAGSNTLNNVLLDTGNVALAGTISATSVTVSSGVTLSGTGTITGDVTNSGNVAPGSSAGILTINGNYTQASTGALSVEIGGTTAGTDYDRLAVTGAASLGGTLNVLEGAVAPVAGTTYTVITCGSCTGSFATVNSPTVNVSPAYAAASFSLPFTSFLNSWNSGGTGAWETASNWSRGVVPGASDDVTIDDPSSIATITISGGTQAARSIVSNENLTLSGGSLNLAASSTVNGNLTVSGGTLNLGGGTLTVGGTLNLSGLSTVIDGAGNLIANGAFNWSGDADMRGTGTLTTNSITSGNDPMYVGRNWINNGTINVASGRLEIAATLTNASGGIVNIQTTGAGNVVDAWGGTVVNQGQFNFSAAGTSTVTAPFSNEGTLTVADGTLNWIGGVTNSGTVNLAGASSIRLPSGGPAFTNAAGGTLNIDSAAGWSFVSNPSAQDGIVENAGTINVNSGTSWEAAFTQLGTGSLNIAAGKFVSLQNGQTIAGTVDVGTGATLWVSERHGVNTSFNGTTIGGGGTVQVLGGAGPVADFTNVSAPSAKLLVGSGGTANVLAGTTTFAALEITGGTLGGAGTLNVTASLNQSGGSQTGGGTTLLASGATGTLGGVSVGRNLTNLGTLDLSGTSISGLFTNDGTVNVTGTVSASAGMQQNAGLTTVPAGQTLGVGGSGLVLAGGTLMGNGTISGNVNNQAGTVAPGASPGILTVVGDYTQGASGVLAVDVGGTVAGSEYDQLKVIGNVFLDGSLNTTLFGSYTPLPGDSYTFIDATGTISGTFANISQPASLLPPTAGPAPTSGSQLTVSAVSASLPPAIEPSYNYTVVATETSSEPVENILIPVLGIEGTAGTEESTLEKKPPACS